MRCEGHSLLVHVNNICVALRIVVDSLAPIKGDKKGETTPLEADLRLPRIGSSGHSVTPT